MHFTGNIMRRRLVPMGTKGVQAAGGFLLADPTVREAVARRVKDGAR